MNIYLISQVVNRNYDTYDSAVVAAEYEEQARNTNPANGKQMEKADWEDTYSGWVNKPEHVSVALIGVAVQGEQPMQAGVILASYNAG